MDKNIEGYVKWSAKFSKNAIKVIAGKDICNGLNGHLDVDSRYSQVLSDCQKIKAGGLFL